MTNRNINRVFCLMAAALVFGAVVSIAAQSDNWRILSSNYDADGNLRIISEADDGRKMTSIVKYFAQKRSQPESEETVVTDAAGNKLSVSYSRWDLGGQAVGSGKESFNASGSTVAGSRWYVVRGAGGFTGPRIDERFNPSTGKWQVSPSATTSTAPSNNRPTSGNANPRPNNPPAGQGRAGNANPPSNNPPAGQGGAGNTNPTPNNPPAGQGGAGNSNAGNSRPTRGPAPVGPPPSAPPRDAFAAGVEGAYNRVKALANEALSDPRKRSLAGMELQTFIQYVSLQAAKESEKAEPNSDRISKFYDLIAKAQADLDVLNSTPASPVPAPADASSPLAETWSAAVKRGETSKTCPANPRKELGAAQTVSYGSGKYFVTSPVCLAAVHANKITFERGGTVRWRTADITLTDAQASIASPPEPRNGVNASGLLGTCGQCAFQFID